MNNTFEYITSYDNYETTAAGDVRPVACKCDLCGQNIRIVHEVTINGEFKKIGGTCARNLENGTINAAEKLINAEIRKAKKEAKEAAENRAKWVKQISTNIIHAYTLMIKHNIEATDEINAVIAIGDLEPNGKSAAKVNNVVSIIVKMIREQAAA